MEVKNTFISSKNLYHIVKKRSINQHELSSYIIAHPEFNRLIGSLPYDWLKCALPSKDIKFLSESIALFFAEFAKAISDIHTRRHLETIRGAVLKFKKFQKVLEQQLKDALQRQDISVNYVGSGSFKHCHRITVGNYDYALSTFINNEDWLNEKYSNYFNDYFQGKGYEPQNVFTLYKKGEHGRWAKPFFAKVAGKDDADGFILSKFIKKSGAKKSPQGIFERKRLKFINNDYASRNTINGVFVDAGACVINNDYIENKEVRYLCLELARTFDRANKIVENYNYRCIDSLIASDIKNNIDIFDKNYSQRYLLSSSQKRAISVILKNLKTAQKFKNRAEQKGLSDSVISIFNKDLQEEFPYLKEVYGDFGKYYSKSFSKLLGISNKPNPKDFVLNYDELSFWGLKKDYSQSEIIEGMIQSWQYIFKKRGLLKRICKDFSIEKAQYEYIKKEGKAIINKK